MVTTVSRERSKAVFAGVFARVRVRVFVARFCEALERFESGFERKFKKVPRVWERKCFYDDTTRESLTVLSLSLSLSFERSASFSLLLNLSSIMST